VKTSSAAKPVTLTNTGNGTLNITTVMFAGADPADLSTTITLRIECGGGRELHDQRDLQTHGKGHANGVGVDRRQCRWQPVSLKGTGTVVKLSLGYKDLWMLEAALGRNEASSKEKAA